MENPFFQLEMIRPAGGTSLGNIPGHDSYSWWVFNIDVGVRNS
jgi:hypothetical protein